jgi:hypothetical protein
MDWPGVGLRFAASHVFYDNIIDNVIGELVPSIYHCCCWAFQTCLKILTHSHTFLHILISTTRFLKILKNSYRFFLVLILKFSIFLLQRLDS